jgi:periplasmic protein CpxP/Spy
MKRHNLGEQSRTVMNRQLISTFTGTVVSIALGAGAVIAPLSTGFAFAQTPSTQTPSPQPHHQSRQLSGLNLTQQQQDQIDQIRNQMRSQVESILSETQRTQIRTAMQQGQDFRAAAAAANISDDQQAQIRQVFQASRQQMASILTPDQQQQLQQHMRERHMQNRQNSPAQSQP